VKWSPLCPQIAFTTAGPPTPGRFSVTPSKGYALHTPFTFAALDWVTESEVRARGLGGLTSLFLSIPAT
jgi:hypothetical protein